MLTKRTVDEYYMRRALSLAWRGLDAVRPNPKVGCVLVSGPREGVAPGRVIGEGWHARYGGPHAEVAALDDAARRGEDVRGATAYVTLEPCSHFGKTPPCAPRLVAEGIARVVVGSYDPNPKVGGRGIAILKDAGVEVAGPCLEKECKWLNRGFFRRHTLNRPWVTLKAAAGLDGRMALPSGESKWITGETARGWAHLLRAEHDGILVGVGTILADDPELTVRNACGKSPLRIILDSNLSTPASAKVLSGGCLILTVCGDEGKNEEKKLALERAGAEICQICRLPEETLDKYSGASPQTPRKGLRPLRIPFNQCLGRVDLETALGELAGRGVQSIMVEGGPKVLSAFIEAGLCDSLALFTAASLMGDGPGLGSGLRFDSMKDIVRLRETKTRRAGDDMLVEGIFQCSPAL